jgi:O-antigen/teichoic acid export membrane protein
LTRAQEREPSATSAARSLRQVTARLDRSYRAVFLTEAISLLLLAVLIKLGADLLRGEDFGVFMVVRSTLTLILPALLVGLVVGVTRFVAIASARGDDDAAEYLVSAFALLAVVLTAVDSASILFPSQLARLMFGSARYRWIIVPFALMATGFCFQEIVYSYFRGLLLMRRANGLHIAASTAPIASILATRDVAGFCIFSGLAWIALSVVWVGPAHVPARARRPLAKLSALTRYGMRRVPGDFFVVALLSLPVTLAAHVAGVPRAGYLSLAITIVALPGYLIRPVGTVLLPVSSRAAVGPQTVEMRREVLLLLLVITALTLIFLPLAQILATTLLPLILGSRFEAVAGSLPKMMVAAWPYAIYVVFRNVIDAFHERAVNGRNSAVALGLLATSGVLAVVITKSIDTIILGFDLAMLCLGLLSILEVRRLLWTRAPSSSPVV